MKYWLAFKVNGLNINNYLSKERKRNVYSGAYYNIMEIMDFCFVSHHLLLQKVNNVFFMYCFVYLLCRIEGDIISFC